MAKLIVEIETPHSTKQITKMLGEMGDDKDVFFGNGGNSVWISKKFLKRLTDKSIDSVRFTLLGVR
jgi:hypothetical protein